MMEESGFGDDDDSKKLRLLSREELESLVEERTAALGNVMDTMVDVLMKLGPDGRIQMVNQAIEAILGYDEEEVVGKPIDYIFADPSENEELSDMMTKGELLDVLISTGHVTDVEIYFSTTDGETIPMSLSASIMEGSRLPPLSEAISVDSASMVACRILSSPPVSPALNSSWPPFWKEAMA